MIPDSAAVHAKKKVRKDRIRQLDMNLTRSPIHFRGVSN